MVTAPSGSSTGPGATSGLSPEQQAVQAERQLLGAFASIPSAKVVSQPVYGGNHVQAEETWQVDASAKSLYAEAAARLPHWPRTGAAADTGSAQMQYQETVQTTSNSATLASQSVDIEVQPSSTNTNISTLQVTVEEAYRPDKPAAERIPDSAVLIVSAQSRSTDKKVITSASTIAQVAKEINALPTLAMHGVFACPALMATPTLDLTFAPSATAPASATTTVVLPSRPGGICSPGVQVTVDGTEQPALDNSVNQNLFTDVEKLTGVTAPKIGGLLP